MVADSYQFDVKYGVASKPPQVRNSRDVPHRSCGHCQSGARADLETVPARGKSTVDAGPVSFLNETVSNEIHATKPEFRDQAEQGTQTLPHPRARRSLAARLATWPASAVRPRAGL